MGQVPTVIPFQDLAPGALDGVFREQRREWLDRLYWDLSTTSNLVAMSIRDRTLKGSAVFIDDEPAGFGFYSEEPDRALVGDLYVTRRHRASGAAGLLAEALLGQIERPRNRRRVENQAISFEAAGVDDAFVRHGFKRFGREYMVAPAVRVDAGAAAGSGRTLVRPWRDDDFDAASETIYQAYRGSVDAKLNAQYRTREGCADLLEVLTSTAWCGRFAPRITRVAVDRSSGRCCGIAIASRISADAAHLGQVSVSPRYQSEGVGRALVLGALDEAAAAAVERVTLAVTEANEPALRLYTSTGFVRRLAFTVYTKDPARLSSFR